MADVSNRELIVMLKAEERKAVSVVLSNFLHAVVYGQFAPNIADNELAAMVERIMDKRMQDE